MKDEEILTEYSSKKLIREKEMKLLWNGKTPPKELVDYWRDTLDKWLYEYSHGSPKLFEGEEFSISDAPAIGQIRKIIISDEDIYAIVISQKQEKGETRWLLCPISTMSIPGTMWEFYANDKAGHKFVVSPWNICHCSDKSIRDASKSSKSNLCVDEDTVTTLMNQLMLMFSTKKQTKSMFDVGPRVFLTNDPRTQYQKRQRELFKVISIVDAPDKEEIEKKVSDTIKNI